MSLAALTASTQSLPVCFGIFPLKFFKLKGQPLKSHKSAKIRTFIVWEACKRKSQSSTCPRSFQLCCIYCDSWCIPCSRCCSRSQSQKIRCQCWNQSLKSEYRLKRSAKPRSSKCSGTLPWTVFIASQEHWKWSDSPFPCHNGKSNVKFAVSQWPTSVHPLNFLYETRLYRGKAILEIRYSRAKKNY